jgi:hypothetical protein
LYARAFLFLKRYLQKGRKKDLELADSTLSEDYKGQDPYFSFIYSVYKSLKADNPEHKKYVIQKNLGVYLKKGSRLLSELLKIQEEIVVEPIVKAEPKQEKRLEILTKKAEIEETPEPVLDVPSVEREKVEITNIKKEDRSILYLVILTILLGLGSVGFYFSKKSQGTNTKDWSAYMGNMNWDEANAKCKSIGMRLPTIDELKAVYNAGITKSWQNDGNVYWSSTPYDAERYYIFGVDSGNTYDDLRNDSDRVRCRR